MVQSVPGSLILGLPPLVEPRPQAGWRAAVCAQRVPPLLVDAGHLLRTLAELVVGQFPPLLISPQTHQLLSSLLESAPRGSPWIEVRRLAERFNHLQSGARSPSAGAQAGGVARLPTCHPPKWPAALTTACSPCAPKTRLPLCSAGHNSPAPQATTTQHQPHPGGADVRERGQPCPDGALPGQQRAGAGWLAHGRRALAACGTRRSSRHTRSFTG